MHNAHCIYLLTVVLFSLYMSLKMTAKSKIFAKDLVKKLAFMFAALEWNKSTFVSLKYGTYET